MDVLSSWASFLVELGSKVLKPPYAEDAYLAKLEACGDLSRWLALAKDEVKVDYPSLFICSL